MKLSEGRNGAAKGNILPKNTSLSKTNGTTKKATPLSVLKNNLKELPPQLTRFQVTLENSNKIFFAGDELKGNVEIDLTENLPIQGIILKIVGEAYVNVSDEPRPCTTRRMGNIRSTFKSTKMYDVYSFKFVTLHGNMMALTEELMLQLKKYHIYYENTRHYKIHNVYHKIISADNLSDYLTTLSIDLNTTNLRTDDSNQLKTQYTPKLTTSRNSANSPSSISERIDLVGKLGDFPVPFYFDSDMTAKWETSTATTVTCPRSQRSTLQRDQNPAVVTKKSCLRRQEEANRRFRSHEKYFEHKSYVFGHKYSSTREKMWSGKHSFPFSYTLPSKLPASFHGRYGYVRYFCEASLERHNLPTIQRRTFFSINTIMDLNTDSKADSGVSKGKKTNSWCFCCASGTVIVSTKVKRRGFVSGETIPVQAHILNVSNKTISKISAKIIQVATYYSSKAFRNHPDEVVVSERVRGAVPPGESSIWDDVGPKVPPIPPSSTMLDCKLITLDYRLDFVIDIVGAKESLVIRMPLRIGTVPLEKTFKSFYNSSDENSAWAALKTELPLNIQSKYSDIPTPYSIKCIKGDRNVNRYYFRQIPRSTQSVTGINLRMPNAPPQPVITDEQEVYAPRYLTYREIDVKRRPVSKVEKSAREKTDLRTTLNGGVLSDDSLHRHLVICLSPPAHSRRITPNSATRLIDATPESGSVWNSPISMKSYKTASKKTLPPMKLDLLNFDTETVRSEKYNQTIREFLEQEKRNNEENSINKY